MATDPKPGGTAVADDEYDYKAPTPAASDDEYDYHAPGAPPSAATAAAPKPKSWLSSGMEAVEKSPVNFLSRGLGAVGDWAQKKSDTAHEEDLRNAAAGKPGAGYAAYTPSAGYDLLARGAKTLSGATSPTALATTAATIAAPEVMGPALLAHGGKNVVEGIGKMGSGNYSPENVEETLNAGAETAGGLGVIGHLYANRNAPAGPGGPITQAARNRSPVERGSRAYQEIIAPNTSGSVQQIEEAEAFKRAAPYLAEEQRRSPVLKKQPNDPTDPNAGKSLGVANYRQNAEAASKRLWEDKIQPITDSYGKAEVDGKKIAAGIRGTINPDSPVDTARADAVETLAKFYENTGNVGEATRKIRAINEDPAVQAYEKALPDKQAEMIAGNPTLDAKIKAANLLRDSVFDSIEKNGAKEDSNYLREARKDFGALRQVSENLGKARVPTPLGATQQVVEAGHTAVRPISRTAPQASRLFSNPNRLAARSSRLLGVSDLQSRAMPPNATVPWVQAQPPGFTPPPSAPQPPPPMNPQFATEATGSVTGTAPGTRGGAGSRIAGLLPQSAESLVPPSTTPPPVDPYFRYTGLGTIGDAQTPISGTTPAGTRFGPRALLPGPIHGTPAQPVGGIPRVGFPADEGLWNVPPRPGNVPGFETPPNPVYEPPAGQVLRPGGLGTIGETPNPFEGREPPELDRPFPKGGVEHGVQRRTALEKEADAKAAAGKERPKPTDEQYQEAKNSLKIPGTLEPEEVQKHRQTVRDYEAGKKAKTEADKETIRKTGTANDRPQYQYKPSEKAATMSEKPKDLGPEFKTDQLTHEVTRNQSILDNPNASEEEKSAARNFFEENPDRKLDKTGGGGTAAERIAARGGKAAPAREAGPRTEFSSGENLVGAAHKTAVLRDASGREIGNAMLTDTTKGGKRGLEVSVSQIESENRGKGFGKQMYNDIIDHAREQGYDYIQSDKSRTQDASRVWESLKNSGAPVRLENGRYVLDVKSAAGGENPGYKTIRKDGQVFAEDPNGVRVSMKEGESPDVVKARLADQVKMRGAFKIGEPEPLSEEDRQSAESKKPNLFSKKNSSATVDQVFGQDKSAEEAAASEHSSKREANRRERMHDYSENAQRIFEGQEPEAKPSWLHQLASKGEERPIHEEFNQDQIRNGELAALAEAEQTLQSDKPGRYFDERAADDMNPQKEQRGGTKAFGSWRGVRSGRDMMPILSRLPDMSATEVMRALRNPKSPAYQKVVRAAIKENLADEARSARLGLNKE